MAPGRPRSHEALDKIRPAFTGFALDEPLLRDRCSGGGADEGVALDRGHRDRDLGDARRGHHARAVSWRRRALRVTPRGEPGRSGMTIEGFETVTLSSGSLEAEFAPALGMAGVSLRHLGEELLDRRRACSPTRAPERS